MLKKLFILAALICVCTTSFARFGDDRFGKSRHGKPDFGVGAFGETSETGPSFEEGDALILESGDYLLLEDGTSKLLLET